ncbi:MAG: tetratricopeptide repeat protein [Fibrobacteria bacterium]|nr:tetratricopeptide repeat protein [Fibrobacteria bacterium]
MKNWLVLLLGAVVAAGAGKTEETVVELVESGRFPEAQEVARTSGASGADLLRINALLFHGAGLTDSALVYLKQVVADRKTEPRMALRLAEAMVWKKSLGPAKAVVDAVRIADVRKEVRWWESATRRALVYLYLQELGKSREAFFEIATGKDVPRDWSVGARMYIAQIAAWTKDFQGCIAMSDSILAIEPGHVQASLVQGEVLEWQGEYARARKLYSDALQKHPEEWRLRDRLEKLSWVK